MKSYYWIVVALAMLASGATVKADSFGTGDNQFNIDFVPISGATNPTGGIDAGGFNFIGVASDYRMGTYEITNDQWNKFKAAYGAVTGADGWYGNSSYYTGINVPKNLVSWYAAAQFVNWLNTSTGHQAAYRFTGTQGTSDYTFAKWSAEEAAGSTNLYRNKDAFYFLPSENEWIKAAFWNGTSLQTYATKDGSIPAQGNGSSGTGWNYYTTDYATNPRGPWIVGSGSQELNGTYDMMGNVEEWLESPCNDDNFGTSSSRSLRGGSFDLNSYYLTSSYYYFLAPVQEYGGVGFRVASVPEPCSFLMVAIVAVVGLLHQRRICRVKG